MTIDEMTSYISVNALEENFGIYTCYVKNVMGDGLPCEIDVTGKTRTFASTNQFIFIKRIGDKLNKDLIVYILYLSDVNDI